MGNIYFDLNAKGFGKKKKKKKKKKPSRNEPRAAIKKRKLWYQL